MNSCEGKPVHTVIAAITEVSFHTAGTAKALLEGEFSTVSLATAKTNTNCILSISCKRNTDYGNQNE